MKKFCARCGYELDETTMGRWFCKNCGILDQNQDNEEDSSIAEPSYVG